MTRPDERCEVRPFRRIRRAYVDVLREGHRRHIIHGLVEVDVTAARAAIRDRAAAGEPPLSFTGFVVACVGQVVDADRMMHAHRWGRRRLVLFENVDVNLQLEQTEPDGTRIVQSRIVRDANHRTVEDISAEIRRARSGTRADGRRLRGTLAFVSLPTPLRALLWRLMMAHPWATKRFGGTIAVSSVGMFGNSLGWGIPITPAPLMVTIGGIGPRPVLVDGDLVERDHLSLTVSVDHDIIDGAPAARFVEGLRRTIEAATGLEAPAGQPFSHGADEPRAS